MVGCHHSRPAQPSKMISRRLPVDPRYARMDSGKSEISNWYFLRVNLGNDVERRYRHR